MPLPSPQKKEKQKDFISRCMSELSHKGEFDSPEQRSAVCYSRWKDAKANDLAKSIAGHLDAIQKND